ncbi:histidinol-phosphate transaminase [Demequina sp. B12]|uniref:histidinol-phosphate transaminase n=1 Tax=Demequina sp. B12 TaxID=2992757 RepID=UPI00237BD697|nr:histidinol-phosphate transaminase [Demequina sp. B12]MDE0572181.1 histidinol-phosphate transaminase [Demequina sp. B12]
MTLPVARPSVAALPAYVPGARGQVDRLPPVKLSSNENPFGPLPSVVEAIEKVAGTVNRYPDMFAVELHERLAERFSVGADQVAVGGGSVAVLQHVLQAYTGAGDEVIFPWRSFEAYPILTPIAGATAVRVPLNDDATHDLEAMAAAVTDRTKIVILCSPNNPTGPSIHEDQFEAFMAAVPQRVLVVLDEAYVEFVRDTQTVDGLEALKRHPNLVLTRTFSKAYGLAGSRVGFALGSAALITPVRACVTPFSVSTVAQASALASLDATDELLERVDAIVAERPRLRDGLRDLGWNVPVSEGNFVWLPAGEQTVRIAQELAAVEPAVLVRPFAGEGIRVTVGTAQENDALLAAIRGLSAH